MHSRLLRQLAAIDLVAWFPLSGCVASLWNM